MVYLAHTPNPIKEYFTPILLRVMLVKTIDTVDFQKSIFCMVKYSQISEFTGLSTTIMTILSRKLKKI